MTAAHHLRLVTPPPAAPDPRLGQIIDGRYVVEQVLGQGGMGMVYRARHRALDKHVAIKVLKPEVGKDDQILARFEREARAASAIGSPHICDVSDFGALEDGSTYFAMEMLDGPSLATVIREAAPLEPARVIATAKKLCDGLGAEHAAGIVHRDLKPDNVHLVPRGAEEEFVKVLDFGIAKMGSAAETKLTVAGQVFGTPHYMSPEQCAGYDVDARTDVYALGVMLYEMACGRLPFDADNLMGLLTKHVYEQPIAPRDLGLSVEIPAGLEAIILRCLAKQPAARYASMAALRADLEAVERGVTPRAVIAELDRSTPPEGRPPLAVALPPAAPLVVEAPPRRWPRIAAIGLALALAAGAAVAVWPRPRAHASLDKGSFPKTVAVDEPPPVDTPPPVDDPVDVPEPTLVTLESDPPGAEVYGPDGAVIGNTPLAVPRPAPGEAPIAYLVRLPRHRDRTVPVGASTADRVQVTLTRGRPGHAPTPTPDATPDTTDDGTSQGFDTIEPVETDLINPFEEGAPPARRRRAPTP